MITCRRIIDDDEAAIIGLKVISATYFAGHPVMDVLTG
jgi:hypothetical protein